MCPKQIPCHCESSGKWIAVTLYNSWTMSLSPGSQVGPYEVIAPLGEGAMGVVFRGRDTRLQRDVALKLLPDHLANEPDRLARFQREAQVLASLNHTNIAQIYGLEHVNGSTCIVMELVEGQTLEERLKQGPLSYDETLDIARQLSDALATAHERGVVHRDLKPANIKLTPNGMVKVLDFGLAKALGPKASDTHMSVMPTMASGSIVGTIVGTPGYMSPEQARGKEVDARTDIWAFGCIVYEMLTGRQAFSGETLTDVMAKIVTSPPDLDLLPRDTPPSLRLLLSAALDKNASHRLQHIGDSRLFLDGTLVADAAKSVAPPEKRRSSGSLLIAALVVALAIAAIPAVLYFRNVPDTPEMHFDISIEGMRGQPLISPDGRTIAYGALGPEGRPSIWLRPINSGIARQLTGTENVGIALWSTDSLKLAFITDGKLKKIDATGGSPQLLGEVTGGLRGGAWSPAGVILLARVGDNVISRIADTGGQLSALTKLDTARGEILHAFPTFLPDGNHFLYLAASSKPEESGIFLRSLDSKESPKRVIPLQPSNFQGMSYVAPGYLLFHYNGRLTAQRMSDAGITEGDPVVVAEGLDSTFSASNTGLLLYHKASPVAARQLLWFNRDGKQVGQVGTEANYGNVDLSPKGDRAAVDIISNSNRDIWIVDLARDVPSRITFDPASEFTASWSSDGSRVAYASTRSDGTKIYAKSSTGAGVETVLSPEETTAIPVHWSPDDKYVVFSRPQPKSSGTYDTWLIPLDGDRKARPFLETPFDKVQARISPDGRWIAYSTNESGMYQVVVQTFPDPNGGRWQITAEGGMEPKWRRDGRELYYLAFDGKLMSVSITGPVFQAGRPASLFQTPLIVSRQPIRDRRYDVAPDGRFLIVTPAATTATLPTTVVVNWQAALEK